MIEQPEHSPFCCGQEAKWVNPTLNLAYFYCTKCKKEVEGSGLIDLPMSSWTGALHSNTISTSAQRQSQALSGQKFKAGDTVSFDVVDFSLGPVRTFGTVISDMLHGWYAVKTLDSKTNYCLYETELTLVP